MSNSTRIVFLAVATIAMAACTSTVVRKGGAASSTPRVSTPKYGATAQVRRGDTMYGIAFRNGIDVRDLAAWNGISAPYTIYPGQSLRLYPRGGASLAVQPASSPQRPAASASRPVTGSASIAPTPVAAKPVARAPVPPAPVAPPASDVTWRWPADGTLLNRFVAGEPTRQGIDIGGESGAPVKAAGDGVVVYSGSGLVGYGELIIIKHNDAWLSAYGHNRARMVNEGAIVKAGQQVAVMGRTGAARDMLHFEIRYNGKPVDPLQYLPKQ